MELISLKSFFNSKMNNLELNLDSLENQRKILFINLVLIITGIPCLLLFGIRAILNDMFLLGISELVIAVLIIVSTVYLAVSRKVQLISALLTILLGFFFTVLLFIGSGKEDVIYLFPFMSIFLLGILKGTLVSLTSFIFR